MRGAGFPTRVLPTARLEIVSRRIEAGRIRAVIALNLCRNVSGSLRLLLPLMRLGPDPRRLAISVRFS